ncbi:MAG: DUF86 domain-containing protein [Clostridia bacterium]|nr:DUF86 domain-containing protein [Clostridia bacterium]
MQPKDKRVIDKIMHRIQLILQYCEGLHYEQFTQNTMISEACVFNLLQIGEMCNKDLSDELKKKYGNVPWRQIYGLRNRIVHGYDEVQLNIIWETIQDDLPILMNDFADILKNEFQNTD